MDRKISRIDFEQSYRNLWATLALNWCYQPNNNIDTGALYNIFCSTIPMEYIDKV